MAQKIKALDHESYWTFSLIAFVVPIVGIILGAIYLGKDEKVDKKLGEHLVALSVLFMIFEGFVWLILVTHIFNQPTITPALSY